MLRKLAIVLSFFGSFILSAQPFSQVKWSFSQKKISADEFDLIFTAKIAPGWHLYSQIETPDIIIKKDGTKLFVRILEDNGDVLKFRKPNNYNSKVITLSRSKDIENIVYAEGPTPTYFYFEKSKDFELVGTPVEPKPHEEREPMFNDSIVRSFSGSAVFTQRVKARSNAAIKVIGYIEGQTCNESTCSSFKPPIDFAFTLTGAIVADSVASSSVGSDSVSTSTNTSEDTLDKTIPTVSEAVIEPASNQKSDDTYLGLFIAGFLGGLLALLTPCVFPMLPMTVSFFIKQSKTKAKGISNAIIYGLSIIGIYIALGLGITLIFGADALNNMSTNIWFNLFFFVLLVVFAISFLGAFEITLPSSFVNKMDAKSDKGGLIGIFFMAFTLSLVSFSCTGPIIGTLLVEAAATGAIAGPFFGMFGFSLALALPFALFAAFPGWLNTLPKSGGWLNSVKVVLGFLELALALKFLSNADMVVQANIVTREVFIAIWVVIFALLGAYLMGWFKLPHDSEMKHVSVGRLMFAIVVFSFTFYMVPGMWGAPLKIISGFPPADFYSESPNGVGKSSTVGVAAAGHTELPEHTHQGPQGIPAFDDYYHALAYAKKVNKPLMIDFTGWACVNCRKMESQVWSDPEVKRRLSEDFVLVSLYVDDKKTLPGNLQQEVVWHGANRKLKSIGDRWSFLQSTKYKSQTQPQYWIIDHNEKHYSDSTSYDPDVQKYIRWLDRGLENYRKSVQ